MRKLKSLIALAIAVTLSCSSLEAQSVKYDNYRIVNKSLTVGKKTTKVADSSAWLEIGDTGTSRVLLLPRTDNSKVMKRVPGNLWYNRQDSSLYFQSGTFLKKITAT